jgi:very-short-patch-repair endonuclease
MTEPEWVLWLMLRDDLLGLHFRRQHPVGPYILEFYCAAAKLCIEIDGPAHDGEEARDARRTAFLAGEGITVLRFSVEDVSNCPAMIIAAIRQAALPTRR